MVEEFAIVLNNPQGVFVVPEDVAGTVVVTKNEPTPCKAIIVELKGKGHTSWLDQYVTMMGQNYTVNTNYYFGCEAIVKERIVLWGSAEEEYGASNNGTLGAGRYVFPFKFALHRDTKVPSSFEGTIGRIRYEIRATIVKDPPQPSQMIYSLLQIVDRVDTNIPAMLNPVEHEIEKTVYSILCVPQTIKLTVSLPRKGFCIGERIPLRVHVSNGSTRAVTLRAAVVKTTTYRGTFSGVNWGSHRLYQFQSPPVGGGTEFLWAEAQLLTITSAIPTIRNSNVVALEYSLLIEVLIPWALNTSVTVPFTLGNVPPGSLDDGEHVQPPPPSPHYPPLLIRSSPGPHIWSQNEKDEDGITTIISAHPLTSQHAAELLVANPGEAQISTRSSTAI